ncbi:potassium-transporting ATPase subunit KdpC [Jeongeupia naejangsanensis]|uniref:Potassium-transporting ATPase KdpC subunit n=1 Tax=Jeongeupia naejangsanensis TaxID=613195 RepID=A0ABS2BHM2_9NEIS|nr:potassium-transporting ATPase subunit KdpC [Jeongeupia naejangsanensis]MBM3115096.1 potassium-transporting ATPase subunit KdpC [Jeongeupia naejangsanensis]
MNISSQLRPALTIFVLLTALTGVLYPAAVTGIAQGVFPNQANGSVISKDGRAVGSGLIGQNFTEPRYFWGRPSATGPMPYNGAGSGGSNLGPTNPALFDAVKARVAALKAADPGNTAPVPVDLVTTSGSGLDPDISPEAAAYQIGRVAKARNLSIPQVEALVAANTTGKQWGFLGEARVNVLKLNLALDALGK